MQNPLVVQYPIFFSYDSSRSRSVKLHYDSLTWVPWHHEFIRKIANSYPELGWTNTNRESTWSRNFSYRSVISIQTCALCEIPGHTSLSSSMCTWIYPSTTAFDFQRSIHWLFILFYSTITEISYMRTVVNWPKLYKTDQAEVSLPFRLYTLRPRRHT
jgi:hypothetical protein